MLLIKIEAESFRDIIAAIDKAAASKLPHSANTMRTEILRFFKGAKLMIEELLSTARSRIHLSFDLSSIVDKLGYFVMDNAGNNDTALTFLNGRIIDNGGIGFDPIERQLRRFAHTINLAVKDLMFGKNGVPKRKTELSEDTSKTGKERKRVGTCF
jgi:hypothetical protein